MMLSSIAYRLSSGAPATNFRQVVLVHIGRKGLPVVILNEPAGDVKDLSFENERSFAAGCPLGV
jgi:hypothetical protein